MTYVCLALLAVLVVTILAFTSLLRSRDRAHARREDLLVNQLLHAAGRAWQPAPAEEPPLPREPLEPYEAELPDWSATPEQLPVA